MNKELLILLSLFSISNCETLAPWHQRKFEFSVSDICSYDDNIFQYVKPCPKNNACIDIENSDHHISTCQQHYSILKTLGDPCKSSSECDSNLVCTNQICTIKSDKTPYSVSDKISSDSFYFCPEGQIAITEVNDITYLCQVSTSNANYCSKSNEAHNEVIMRKPDFRKICGEQKIEFISNVYISYDVSMNLIGQVQAGKAVHDERACESGFALYLPYVGGNLDPKSDDRTATYLTCVNLKEVDTYSNGKCKNIKYTLNDDNEYVYKYQDVLATPVCKNIMSKLELFKLYRDKRGNGCTKNKEYFDEPFTCGNDELRELWYFYHNPDQFLLYKNEQAIKDYLIQKKYPTYNPKYAEPNTSGYIGIKFISLLVLLLSL